MSNETRFKELVYELVSQIPRGRVMSYGQIAALCGKPQAARQVGQIAHFGPEQLPWQRVVKSSGDLASGYWGGREIHARDLMAEGIKIKNYKIVGMERYRWQP